MPEALGHPYPGEVLRTAQEVAEKLRPFYESANFSMFNAASEQAARLNKSLRTINAINVKCAKQLEVASALTRHIDPALYEQLCNPGVCCGRNSEAEGSTSAENRGQTHAQTSKLI